MIFGMNKFLAFLIVLASILPACAQTNGVAFGLIRKTFYLKAGKSTGTAFVIEHKGKQYLVTAKHVVAGLPRTKAHIQIFRTGDWKDFVVTVNSPKNDVVDIAVLAINEKLISDEDAGFGELTTESVLFGGEVYFLGYPYGLHTLFGAEYIPFIKKGVLSAIDSTDPTASVVYIDGFNNEGFSGGPVVFFDAQKKTWKIIGVVQGYLPEAAKMQIKKEMVDTRTLVNSGILVAYNIKHVLETLEQEQ
jgi:S1-C subfamily serine protease